MFVLSQVVEALNRGDNRIPYRDSKLTRLLQDSLGGNSYSCMVANIGPSSCSFSDTQNCLNFASKSRKIINTTTVQRTAPVTALPRLNKPPLLAVLQPLKPVVKMADNGAPLIQSNYRNYKVPAIYIYNF